jgi:hypothetical protein
MADDFRTYVAECFKEAPNALRRGFLIVTIIANIAVAAALYLGWHYSAFTALQLWTGAAFIAALEILTILPYKLWKANRAEIKKLQTAADRAKERQALLDDVSDLRTEMARFRIEMTRQESLNIHPAVWENRLHDLERRIGEKIEKLAGKAEAMLYSTRGNITRRLGDGAMPHQLSIDIAIFDLDYLREFIIRHSSLAAKPAI